MERWNGRVALVTGASAGIGAAICKALVESGMKVVGAARRVEKIQNLADSLKHAKGTLTAIKCDLNKDEDIYHLFDEIKKLYGGVDICVNNAAFMYYKSLLDGTPEEWREMTNVNLIALCLCSKLSINSMQKRGVDDGHVININSIAGHKVIPSPAIHFYSGTKSALKAITEGLRQEMRALKSNIRITSVSPGFVRTEFAVKMHGDEKRAEQTFNTYAPVPLHAEDIAATLLHIISAPSHVEINEIIIRPTSQDI